MNADARMTRRGCQHMAGRILPHGKLLCTDCQAELGEWRGPWSKAAHGPENCLAVDFTDAPSMSPGERDDMSVATGDDWA